jgi:hypothetical protein
MPAPQPEVAGAAASRVARPRPQALVGDQCGQRVGDLVGRIRLHHNAGDPVTRWLTASPMLPTAVVTGANPKSMASDNATAARARSHPAHRHGVHAFDAGWGHRSPGAPVVGGRHISQVRHSA